MKPTLLLLCLLLVLSSCTQNNYVTISGKNVAKNEQRQLVAENDTLRIT